MIFCNIKAKWSEIIKYLFFKGQFPDHEERNGGKMSPEIDYEMLAFILDGSLRMKIYANLLTKPNYTYHRTMKEKLISLNGFHKRVSF